ncbi:alpha/beta fold hydrolase [Rossellomorea sp. BNER]|uniref:alpha/beta fold hydrolase n=1 Tax=Rossellomorea sp. BNER TaxID=2962031 RepID=UPI003AF209FD|nr:alpha/beta hydrolase [Rossellomorea sp. BNER]
MDHTQWNMNLIRTSRGEFEVFTKGIGEPLCVTHLYSEFNHSGDYFAESFTETHRVHLVNLREAGNSERARDSYQLSMLETVFDIEAIRESLGYKQWSFAGHSTGGMLGVLYGISFSESLKALVIVGAAAREYWTFSNECIYNPQHPNYQQMQGLIEELKRHDLSNENRKILAEQRTKLSLHQPEKYESYFNKPIHKKMSGTRMDYFNRELPIFDLTRKLSLITVRTLIICGKYDVQCPLPYSMEMNEGIPNSKLITFHHSNHYPFLEEEGLFKYEIDVFFQEINKFVY